MAGLPRGLTESVVGVMHKPQDWDPDGTLRGRANAPQDELRELGQELREHEVSARTRLLLAKLASYPPNVRLVINMKAVIGRMKDGPIYSVLRDGLSDIERAALVELDILGLSTKAREIAHGLLNVHERWVAIKALRNLFAAAVNAESEYLEPRDMQGAAVANKDGA